MLETKLTGPIHTLVDWVRDRLKVVTVVESYTVTPNHGVEKVRYPKKPGTYYIMCFDTRHVSKKLAKKQAAMSKRFVENQLERETREDSAAENSGHRCLPLGDVSRQIRM